MSKGGSSGNQTVTQQNIPDWAMGHARNTLNMGNQYTMNPDYRPSTLDRDYSGIRGYNAQGQPNSQVGQFGLNPSPTQPKQVDATPTGEMFGGGFEGVGKFVKRILDGADTPQSTAERTMPPSSGIRMQTGRPVPPIRQVSNDSQRFNRPGMGLIADPNSPGFVNDSQIGRGLGRTAIRDTNAGENYQGGPSGSSEYTGPGWDLDGDGKGYFYDGDGATESGTSSSDSGGSSSNQSQQTQTQSSTNTEEEEPSYQFNPEEMTPFTAYDRQRFAAPGENTLRGEGVLSGRYDQRFGPKGSDPFAAATTAVDKAADYQSGFQGTMGGGGLGGQAGNYQQGLGSATDPNVFQSGNYTSGLPNFANPNAGMGNVNQGLQAQQFGNANQGLQGPVNYQQAKSLRDSMQQFQDPYTDRVVNQTMKDMDRARQMTANQISGDSAKAGAYGGSRSMLMQAENNRNFADRTAAAVGQLRSQGFQRAADLAQQEQLQRLGLSASDVQNVRGLSSQGNLQGQNLTARDLQNVRGLTSQGGLAAQGLQSQGALAALGANAGLYQSALGLNAAGDRSAMGYNAGLLSDAMGLDASDLNQRRNIASSEAQFSENADRGAGALNLQGGQALGQLAQAGTADERQRIADMLASGQAGDARNQQDLDFIYNEFNRELDYPGRQIDLRNAAISPATGSIVQTTQPRYQSNPLLGAAGAGMSAYGMTGNPYAAGGAALLSLLYG